MARAMESMEELLKQKKAIEEKIEKRRQLDIAKKNDAIIKKIRDAGLYELGEEDLLQALENLKALSAKKKE